MRAVLVSMVLLAGCATAAENAEPVLTPVIVVESSYCYFGLQPVHFRTGSLAIAEGEEATIDEVARMLRRSPGQFALVELSGHASAGETHPKALSLARANAFRDALLARGIEPARVRAVGYGDKCTQGDLGAEGRFKDRRVELKIVRTEDGDTGVELGCDAGRNATD